MSVVKDFVVGSAEFAAFAPRFLATLVVFVQIEIHAESLLLSELVATLPLTRKVLVAVVVHFAEVLAPVVVAPWIVGWSCLLRIPI